MVREFFESAAWKSMSGSRDGRIIRKTIFGGSLKSGRPADKQSREATAPAPRKVARQSTESTTKSLFL
jgi:hypothetical protein